LGVDPTETSADLPLIALRFQVQREDGRQRQLERDGDVMRTIGLQVDGCCGRSGSQCVNGVLGGHLSFSRPARMREKMTRDQ
jgi:hypothetical protein